MNLANISDNLTELEKQNEAISFRLYLIENYNQQVKTHKTQTIKAN
jgi:hypothetical protein